MLMRPSYNICSQNQGCPCARQGHNPVPGQAQRTVSHGHCPHADSGCPSCASSQAASCTKPVNSSDECGAKKMACDHASRSGCRSMQDEAPLNTFPLGNSYVPMQPWCRLYTPSNGFCRGTLFEALDYPFLCTNCPDERRGL